MNLTPSGTKTVRVLLVEDNPGDADLIIERGTEDTHRPVLIHVAGSLAAAQAALPSGAFDLILLNLGLPDSMGLATFDAIQAVAPDTPIVVLSGNDDSDLAGRCVLRGAEDYLVKGRVEGYIAGLVHNALERARLKKELRAAHANLEQMIQRSHDGVLVLDDAGTILFANRAALEMIDGSLAVGGNFEVPATNELELVRADGTARHVEIRTSASAWYGAPARVITLRDVSERKQAEQALRDSEDKFRFVFDNSIIGKSLTLPTGEISVNKAFCDMLGYTAEELRNRRWQDITTPEDIELTNCAIAPLLAGEQEAARFLKRYVHKSGAIVWGDVSTFLRRTGDGRPLYFITAVNDITERKRVEEEIRVLNTELEARVEQRTAELRAAQEKLLRQERLALLGQLAGGVAHELRNPLAVIGNAIYYLRLIQPDASAKVIEYLGMVEREIYTAERIVGDLLNFARVKGVDRAHITVKDLVDEVLVRFPVGAKVRLLLDLPAGLPAVFVDRHQIAQVLGNLVTNACQAMPGGGELVIRGVETGDREPGAGDREPGAGGRLSAVGRPYVALSVRDTGVGIPPENLEKIFEPLFTTKTKGIGLGLAICKKLIEANDGRIEVQSEPGVGSTFTLWLPVP